ncbi:MAG: hypothetical protein AAF196_11720 [Planctomycetota bacterium]
MTSTRRFLASLWVLLLVGGLPGHGGGSGGVVVLPHAVSLEEVDTVTLATHSFDTEEDINLRLAPELASASVAIFADSQEIPVVGSIEGVSISISANEISMLQESGVHLLKYEFVVPSGKAQVLRLELGSAVVGPTLEVR